MPLQAGSSGELHNGALELLILNISSSGWLLVHNALFRQANLMLGEIGKSAAAVGGARGHFDLHTHAYL